MSSIHYDLIVIGTGPGGEGAAIKAAKHGRRVAIIEKYQDVGGGCTHWGTIPSKALRHAVKSIQSFSQNPLFRDKQMSLREISFEQVVSSATSVISQQVAQRASFYARNLVEVIHGHARFVGEKEISITNESGSVEHYTADNFVIATGSRPYRPKDIDFDHPRIFDSDTILKLKDTPMHITIYGAGVIGSEYASIFR